MVALTLRLALIGHFGLTACTPLQSAADLPPFGGELPFDASVPSLDAASCATSGVGTFMVAIEAPKGVTASLTLDPDGDALTLGSGQEVELPAGNHTLVAPRVTVQGPVIGQAYYPSEARQTLCIADGLRSSVTVKYEAEPGSNRLWVSARAGSKHTASYTPSKLTTPGALTTTTTISGAALDPSALAFDGEGNLWIADRAGKVLGYARDMLGTDRATSNADIVLEGASVCTSGVPCGPVALAFDTTCDLWLAMPDRILRISSSQLRGRVEPSVASTMTGVSINKPLALAFDHAGSLWIANGGDSSVVRFAASRLRSDDDRAADTTLLGQALGDVSSGLSTPTSLAFDATGNLWAGYYAPNVIVRYTAEDQLISGVVTAQLQLALEGYGFADGLAFDEFGNLWATGAEDHLLRFAATTLTDDGDHEAPPSVLPMEGPGKDLAFDPPALGTPLAR